jgi:CheY-like chemotaxis protein
MTDKRHKILVVDDDADLLEIYRETFAMLPSNPEIHVASSGSRAIAMLENTDYRVLVSDLNMPKMDGLQLLSVVRRQHPDLRTVVLTAVVDEQFRSRVYALGVDLYWHKPATEHEMKMFLHCLESLLGRDNEVGFRGVQSKSLVDIVQLECISQSSSVLRITNGPLTGRIWVNTGDVIDAEVENSLGEEAFQKILRWRNGSFEFLPPEPGRPRTIYKSYNALLLETAQAIDELAGSVVAPAGPNQTEFRVRATGLNSLIQLDGVEFALAFANDAKRALESRGLDNPEKLADWSRRSLERFQTLGDKLQAGAVQQVDGLGLQRNVAVAQKGGTQICVGWENSLDATEVRERMKKAMTLWAS